MNIHYQAARYWNDAEDAQVLEMRKNGASCKEIARAVDRSPIAVSTRLIAKHRVYKYVRAESSTPPLPTMCILKANLPMMYEQGWRVVGFSGDAVQLEWPHKTNPYLDDLVTVLRDEKLIGGGG